MKPTKPQRFKATLTKDHTNLGWTTAQIPFDPARVWPERIRLRVKGEVNGFAFRTSLFPDPRGGFFLLVNRTVQQGAGIHLGDTPEFHLEPDLDPREAELPDELAALLEEEPNLRAFYDSMSEYMRREICKWVTGVKSDAARLSRAEQMAERLLSTMDAEQELPPILTAAFRMRPRAKQGWAGMTPTQRRNELFAIFYHRTPESRQRRIEKLLDTAEKNSASNKA